ncbi:unnamed protein product, partial [Rotaria sordida]
KEKGNLNFAENFALSGLAAIASKTAAASIERVQLFVRNQGYQFGQGTISRPYSGLIDCAIRTFKSEGLFPFWRDNTAKYIRYLPIQVDFESILQKYTLLIFFSCKNFVINVSSGAVAGILSICFIYPHDLPLTRLVNDRRSVKRDGGAPKI